ncbi:vitamin K epoxide reductase family protein [Frigoribacterium sp. MCBA15_019]|uniref:vitamin K epoxide reductase family protein n=1 Tax=unclassified Frigoribacterium TaxID=2627005 RepID=UPI000A8564C2|nr:vitamin K epoxide reductase family protein [Frigoribacterium sp. MCBA15_019]
MTVETPRAVTLPTGRTPFVAAVLLIVSGLGGLVGAFALTLDKFRLLENPGAALGCDVNPFVGCSPVINSWQASLFGFPNPILGLIGFAAPVAVGLGLLAGARFARWFWLAFNLGLLLAWVFVTWLFTQTVFVIGALCPWCMLVWLFTIPLFWVFTVWGAARGVTVPEGPLQRAAARFLPYSWVLPVLNYIVVATTIVVVFPLLLPTLFG